MDHDAYNGALIRLTQMQAELDGVKLLAKCLAQYVYNHPGESVYDKTLAETLVAVALDYGVLQESELGEQS